MKTIIYLVGFLVLPLIVSCSSVKTVNSWQKNKSLNLESKNVIVFSKTNDTFIRKQFESDLTSVLKENKIHGIESFTVFPKINTNKKLNSEEQLAFVSGLRNKGIDIIILTSLKNVQEYSKTVSSGTNYASYTYPVVYRYNKGFYRYYTTVYYETAPMSYETYKVKKYVLETVIYNLTKPKDEQLVSIISSEIDNPQSLEKVSKDFSKGIVKQLLK